MSFENLFAYVFTEGCEHSTPDASEGRFEERLTVILGDCSDERAFAACRFFKQVAQHFRYCDIAKPPFDSGMLVIGPKSHEHADAMILEGDHQLRKDSLSFALTCYSAAVASAPFDDLGRAFSRRSRALLHAQRFEDCIVDVDNALRLKDQLNNVEISYQISIKRFCCERMGYEDPCALVAEYHVMKRLLQTAHSPQHQADRLVEALELLMDRQTLLPSEMLKLPGRFGHPSSCQLTSRVRRSNLTSTLPDKMCRIPTHVPALPISQSFKFSDWQWQVTELKRRQPPQEIPELSSPNPANHCLSDAVKIETDHLGRQYLVAARDIRAGELIAVEQPWAAVVHPDEHCTYCDYCKLRSFTLIPCQLCSVAMFCDEVCRDEAMAGYHGDECSILRVLLFAMRSWHDLETATLALRMFFTSWHESNCSLEFMRFRFLNHDAWPIGLPDEQAALRSARINFNSIKVSSPTPRVALKASLAAASLVHLLREHSQVFNEPEEVDESYCSAAAGPEPVLTDKEFLIQTNDGTKYQVWASLLSNDPADFLQDTFATDFDEDAILTVDRDDVMNQEVMQSLVTNLLAFQNQKHRSQGDETASSQPPTSELNSAKAERKVTAGDANSDKSLGVDNITTDTLRVDNVTSDTLGSNEVTTDTLGSHDVTPDTLGSNDVTSDTLVSNDVKTDTLGSNNVTTDTLGVNNITPDTLVSNDVTPDKLGSNDVTTDTLGSNDITTDTLGRNDVTSDTLGVDNVTPDTLGSYDVTPETPDNVLTNPDTPPHDRLPSSANQTAGGDNRTKPAASKRLVFDVGVRCSHEPGQDEEEAEVRFGTPSAKLKEMKELVVRAVDIIKTLERGEQQRANLAIAAATGYAVENGSIQKFCSHLNAIMKDCAEKAPQFCKPPECFIEEAPSVSSTTTLSDTSDDDSVTTAMSVRSARRQRQERRLGELVRTYNALRNQVDRWTDEELLDKVWRQYRTLAGIEDRGPDSVTLPCCHAGQPSDSKPFRLTDKPVPTNVRPEGYVEPLHCGILTFVPRPPPIVMPEKPQTFVPLFSREFYDDNAHPKSLLVESGCVPRVFIERRSFAMPPDGWQPGSARVPPDLCKLSLPMAARCVRRVRAWRCMEMSAYSAAQAVKHISPRRLRRPALWDDLDWAGTRRCLFYSRHAGPVAALVGSDYGFYRDCFEETGPLTYFPPVEEEFAFKSESGKAMGVSLKPDFFHLALPTDLTLICEHEPEDCSSREGLSRDDLYYDPTSRFQEMLRPWYYDFFEVCYARRLRVAAFLLRNPPPEEVLALKGFLLKEMMEFSRRLKIRRPLFGRPLTVAESLTPPKMSVRMAARVQFACSLLLSYYHLADNSNPLMECTHTVDVAQDPIGRPARPATRCEETSMHPNHLLSSANIEFSRFGLDSYRPFGAAVYSTTTYLPHSCDPNVFELTAAGDVGVWAAVRHIAKGEKLNVSYGMHCAIAVKYERRKDLRREFGFACECGACERRIDPKHLATRFPLLICFRCRRLLDLGASKHPGARTQLCPKCNWRNHCHEGLRQISVIRNRVDCIRQSLYGRPSAQHDFVPQLSADLEVLHHHVQRPCQLTYAVEEAMKMALMQSVGNFYCIE